MGESFDHCPPGWIRQSRKRCTQFIHNHMVVDYLSMSSVNFAIPDFCSLIPQRASVGRQFSGRATLEEARCRELLLQNDLFLKHQ